jgi:hypothetical protein
VLELFDDRQQRVDILQTCFARNVAGYPLRHADQDVLNAVLGARVERDRAVGLQAALAATPPYAGISITDENSLRCVGADGREPYLLHQWLIPKPWMAPTYDGVYTRLLRRLLGGPDLAIEVPRRSIPLRLRTGPLAYAERQRVNLREQLRWRLGGLLGREA